MNGFDYHRDAAGIVTVTMNMAGAVNSMNAEYRRLMDATLERLENEPDLQGVIFTSAKATFFAGGDLNEFLAWQPGQEQEVYDTVELLKSQLQRLEQLRAPVAAAINGAALGGGFELCLACNYRVMLDQPKAVAGLPEVTLGLLPGAGGIVRLVRLLGLRRALPLVLEGNSLSPAQAAQAGLVNALADSPQALLAQARRWLLDHPAAWRQPWDDEQYPIPGGTADDPAMALFVAEARAQLLRRTRGLLPAPIRIFDTAVASTCLDYAAAMHLESRGLAELTTTVQAKNLITANFFQLNKVNGGGSRPRDIAKTKLDTLGIAGVDALHAEFADVVRRAGIAVLNPANDDMTAHCDLIAEAVCDGAPLTRASRHRNNYIGLHFAAAPAQARLIEIIRGAATPDDTVARAFDLVRRISKTPVIVSDTPGFFTARIRQCYADERARLLGEGIEPELLDRRAWQLGMPVALAEPVAVASEPAEAHDEIKQRLLFRQVIEALRCFEQGVIGTVAEANIASLLGCDAPAWTGGLIQFVNTHGPARFAEQAQRLATRHGERFAPPRILAAKIATNDLFL